MMGRVQLMSADNWLAWKRKIMAILRDLDLESVLTDSGLPHATVAASPTDAEKKAIDEWKKKDSRAKTRIELAVGDSEMSMIHLLGAMWDQLKTSCRSARAISGSRRR
jgi:ribosomal protein L12E/L44/L45/RPP1/RPP2